MWQRLNCALGRHSYINDPDFAPGDITAPATCACGATRKAIIWSRGPMPRLPSQPVEPIIERIRSLTVKPGDVIAISIDQHITKEQAEQIKGACGVSIPGVKCIVLSRGMGLIHIAAPYATGGYIAPAPHPAEAMGFDAWMRERTEQAHAAYMARHAAGGTSYAEKGYGPRGRLTKEEWTPLRAEMDARWGTLPAPVAAS